MLVRVVHRGWIARPGRIAALALVTGLGAIPLVLTGPAYEPGMTHLPGVALCLAVVMCAVRSRWVLAGVLVGLLLLTKLILAPIAAGALLVVALHRGEPVHRCSAPLRAASVCFWSDWGRCGYGASCRAGSATSPSTARMPTASSGTRSRARRSATCCAPSPRMGAVLERSDLGNSPHPDRRSAVMDARLAHRLGA